jgi:uncharacterized protein YciI
MAKFVSLLTFDKADEERRLGVRPAHREYLKSLFDQGKLVLSGPFADDSGALIIYEAADEAEARTIIGADPYTTANVVASLQLKEWRQIYPES